MIWVLIGAMALGVIGFIIFPLFRRGPAGAATQSVDESDYLAAQLSEVSQSTENIADDVLASSDTEARRRLLAELRRKRQSDKKETAPQSLKSSAILVAGAAPLVAVIVYLSIGRPNYEAVAAEETARLLAEQSQQQAAIAAMPEEERRAVIANMVEGLASRLQENPDDLEGWLMLARSYAVLGRTADSTQALARAVTAFPDDERARLAYAQSLMAQRVDEGAAIDDDVTEAFEAVLALNENQPMALFVLGDTARRAGNREQAREYWTKVLAQMPDDSPEAAQMAEMIDSLE